MAAVGPSRFALLRTSSPTATFKIHEPELRRHIEELLAAQEKLGDFLARPPVLPQDTGPVFSLDVMLPKSDVDREPFRSRIRGVVLTQACDLANAKTTRVLVAIVHRAPDLVAEGVVKTTVLRDQIRRCLGFGWYFLPAAPTPIDLPGPGSSP